jgi:hypothetical protein
METKLKELLQSLTDVELTDVEADKIIAAMKEQGIYLSAEENIDIRYRRLKEKLEQQPQEPPQEPPKEPQAPPATPEPQEPPQEPAPDDGKDARITALEAENAKLKLEAAIKVELLANGAKADAIDYLLFKIGQMKDISVGDDDKIKGIDFDEIKKIYPAHFDAKQQRKVEPNPLPTPGPDGGTVTKEQFAKMPYAERTKLKKSDPDLYGKLAKGE